MLFIFSTPVLIRHLWQLKTVVFLHQCLIHALQIALIISHPFQNYFCKKFIEICEYHPREGTINLIAMFLNQLRWRVSNSYSLLSKSNILKQGRSLLEFTLLWGLLQGQRWKWLTVKNPLAYFNVILNQSWKVF